MPGTTPATRRPIALGDPLTVRERMVLDGMARGRTNAEIARDLGLSADTTHSHARRLFVKLGVNCRAGAVGAGFRKGLLRIERPPAGAGAQR